MKLFFISALLIILTGCVVFLLFKQGNLNTNIVYINTPKLLAGYKGMKDAQSKVDLKTKEWQTNIDTLGKELEREIKNFEKSRTTLTAKELKLSEQLLQNRQEAFIQYQQTVQKKASEEDQRIKGVVLSQINEFITDFGKKNGYKFIMGATSSGNIIYADEKTDITDKLLNQLNNAYKK